MLSRRFLKQLALTSAVLVLAPSIPTSRGEDCNNNGVDDAVGLVTCPTANVVFLIDTSESTNPDVRQVCAAIRVALDELGPSVNAEILEIGPQNLGLCLGPNGAECCTGTVPGEYGSSAVGLCEVLGDCSGGQGDLEDWGTATAIVAANKTWGTGTRIIIPFSDEGPRCGGTQNQQADHDVIENVIAFVRTNHVIVAPMVTTEFVPIARVLADGGAPTGRVLDITSDTLATDLVDFIESTCPLDCNANNVPDSCDIADFTSLDADRNGIPDECGACCIDAQQCRNVLNVARCLNLAGTFFPNVVCGAWPGLCGAGDAGCCNGATCSVRPVAECLDDGHQPLVEQLCDFAPCNIGACCTNVCIDTIPQAVPPVRIGPQDCIGGVYVGGTECKPDTCPFPLVGNTPDTPLEIQDCRPERFAKNRFISFRPGNRGRQIALEVEFVNLPPPFNLPWSSMFVGEPQDVSELSGKVDDTPPTFKAATLQCIPVFRDWGDIDVLHVYHELIVPSAFIPPDQVIDSTYSIRAVASDGTPSAGRDLVMSVWGNVVGMKDPATGVWTGPDRDEDGNPQVDITMDVIAVLDKFKNAPTAPIKPRTDIQPAHVELKVSIVDVTRVLDAFKGAAYPFVPPLNPVPCP